MTTAKKKTRTPAPPPKLQAFHGLQVDIEALAITPDAAVLSIGLVLFTTTGVTRSAHFLLDLEDQEKLGRYAGASTVLFWMDPKQEQARLSLTDKKQPKYTASEAHTLLREWSQGDVPVWACGPDYDFTILKSLMQSIGKELPWKYWMQRDFRTIKALAPALDIPKTNAHDAEADAIWQAEYLIALNKKMQLV